MSIDNLIHRSAQKIMNDTQTLPVLQWRELRSLKAIEQYQAQFDVATLPEGNHFDCETSYGTMPNGAWGRIEVYSLRGEPKMMVKTANDHSYGRVFARR